MEEAWEGQREQGVLLHLVSLGRAGSGAGRRLTLDGEHGKFGSHQAAQARHHKAVCAHVGRLFLHPQQFVRVLVRGEGVQNVLLREGIELVQEENRRVGIVQAFALGLQVVPDLARTEQDAGDLGGRNVQCPE